MHHLSSCLYLFAHLGYALAASSCGIDNSPITHVYEGITSIENYPWLGYLYYRQRNQKFTTAVVLVNRQIALATADEVDRLPKHNFRSRARVVIGNNCSGPSFGVRDYSYHPSYSTEPFSALAMIQLDIEGVMSLERWRPICRPPTHFKDQTFYAMVLSNSCSKSRVRIHKMKLVAPEQCKNFYRRSGVDVDSMWPSYTACARSTTGGECVWRSGAILVVKIKHRWRLLGFGIYGPGCQSPARFMDYGKYHKWVASNVERMGKPSITPLADNHIVMRRSLGQIQRFGTCDEEEKAHQAYTDYDHITSDRGIFNYNISLYGETTYPCIELLANHKPTHGTKPKMRLRQWCIRNFHYPNDEVFLDPIRDKVCFESFRFGEVHFNVEITFEEELFFQVTVYRKAAERILIPKKMVKYTNSILRHPVITKAADTYDKFQTLLGKPINPWFLTNAEVQRRLATTTTSTTTTTTTTTSTTTTTTITTTTEIPFTTSAETDTTTDNNNR